MLKGYGLDLPQNVTVLPIELEDTVGIIGRWNRAALGASKGAFIEATVARRYHYVTARSDRWGTPYATTWRRASNGRKIETWIQSARGQINCENLSHCNRCIRTLGRDAYIGTTVGNCRRRIADFGSSAGGCNDSRLPDTLTSGRIQCPQPPIAA